MPLISSELIDVYSITEGLNTVKSGVRLTKDELKDCQNIRYNPIGGFKWRQGYEDIGDAPGQPATGLYMARFSNGTNTAFRTRGSKIEKMDSLDGTWDDLTGSLSLSSGQNNHFVFDILNDIVIGVNGVNDPVQVNSSLTASAVSTLPGSAIASAVFQHRGYMFYITSDKAFFSDLNTPATVQTNNYIQPGSKAGGNLVGGIDYLGAAYIWKRHGIYKVEFQPTRVNSSGDLFPFVEAPDAIVAGVGTQSHKSIVKFRTPSTHKNPGQDLVFFVDQFGVPSLFDGHTALAIGRSILTSRDGSIMSLANMQNTRLPQVWALNDPVNNLIYCFMSSTGQTQHDTCWLLDYSTGFAWSRDLYANTFNCGAIFEGTDGIFVPYFGDYTGQVYEMNSAQTDNGTAITSYARSGDFYLNSPAVQSKWLYNEIRGTTGSDSQAVTIEYFKDGEDTASSSGSVILFKEEQDSWDEVYWDDFYWVYAGLTTKSSEINIEAKTLSVKFSNSTSGSTASIEGYTLFAIPEGWKQED